MPRALMPRAPLLASLVCVALACDATDEPEAMDAQPGEPDYRRDPALDVEMTSRHDTDASFGMVGNCMTCHQERGPGRGRFTVAGSVVGPDGEPEPNPIIELRRPAFADDGSDIEGELVATIEGDLLGNFYTTRELPLPEESLVPWVYSADRTLGNHMPFGGTVSGACNVCHVGSNPIDLKPLP